MRTDNDQGERSPMNQPVKSRSSSSQATDGSPKLLILTQYFPPEMGAPQTRLSELAERLIDRGWQVEALTALPNYFPAGKILGDYDPKKPVVEQVGRTRTVRVPLTPAKQGFLKRLWCYLSFVRSARKHGPRLCSRPDLILAESPPLFICWAARYLARKWNTRYVANISDLWPESLVRMGVVRRGLAVRLAESLESSFYRNAAGVTGQSEEIIEWVRQRAAGVPTQVITNGVSPDRFGKDKADDESRRLLGDSSVPTFLYAGLMGYAQGLDQILDAAAKVPRETPIRFVLMGEGPEREKLAERVAREKLDRVIILPSQPRDRVPAMLAAADATIIPLKTRLPGAVPSKIYESMASSLPIVLIADGEPKTRVERAGCGFAVSPGDVAGAADACARLAADPDLRKRLGEAGRKAAESEYDRDRIAGKLDAFLRERLGRLEAGNAASHGLRKQGVEAPSQKTS
ncbi:MAG: glycosyltransferase family 4 protein [Planctomycetales bacterium]